MKKLSFLFIFAAIFAFVACGPAAEKKVQTAEEVIEEVVKDAEAELDTLEAEVEEVVEKEGEGC